MGSRRTVQKSDVILLEVVHQAGVVDCSVILLIDSVITTQTRALSHDPHRQPPFDTSAQPEAPLKEKIPQIMMEHFEALLKT